MTTSLLNFVANGTVTTNAQANITSVGVLTGLTVNGVSNLSNVGNVKITGGNSGQAIITDGAGNLSFANLSTSNGTVTQINTSGSGLGFNLGGGPITTTGTVALTVPNAISLRSSLSIGNIANLNLNGNGSTALRGNGAFVTIGNVSTINLNGSAIQYLQGDGLWSMPDGTYSNANVANYLPTYTGNLNPNNIVAINNITANSNIFAPNVAANFFVANTANIVLGLNGNIANFVTITSTNINGTTGNFTGNITSANANLGNSATANYFIGNGSLLTGISTANANYANFAGTAFSVSGSNVSGAVAFATTANAVAGANVSGAVANATYAVSSGTANTVTTAAQPNITSVGTLTSLTVSGNIGAGNITGGNLVTANYFSGNGYLLTGITATGANFANYAGNVTVAGQSNITSLGTLTSLNVSGQITATGNANLTGANVSLGNVANLHITGGINGYILQTDGAGNISWVIGGGSGNGVVGGSNTQVQFNDAGNFGGNANLTFNKTTGITTGSFENIFRGLVKNKGQTTASNVAGNTVLLNFDVLSGPILVNTAGLDITSNSNVTTNCSMGLNFRGNSTTSLDSILNPGDSINLKYIQVTTFTSSNSSATSNVNISIGSTPSSLPAGVYNQVDGGNIEYDFYIWQNGTTTTGNAVLSPYPASGTIILNNIGNYGKRYGYLIFDIQITKISNDPSYIVSIDRQT